MIFCYMEKDLDDQSNIFIGLSALLIPCALEGGPIKTIKTFGNQPPMRERSADNKTGLLLPNFRRGEDFKLTLLTTRNRISFTKSAVYTTCDALNVSLGTQPPCAACSKASQEPSRPLAFMITSKPFDGTAWNPAGACLRSV